MNDLGRYILILNKIKRDIELTPEELEFFTNFSGELDDNKLKEQLTKEGLDSGEIDNMIAIRKAFVEGLRSPDTKSKYIDKLVRQKSGRLAASVRRGLNIALQALGLGMSASQMREARRLLRQPEPAPPPIQGGDPELRAEYDRALSGAARRRMLRSSLLNDLLTKEYLSNIQRAREASAGQASVYGALAQQSALNRDRLYDTVMAQAAGEAEDEQRRAALLSLRQNENAARQQAMLSRYPYDIYRFANTQNLGYELGMSGLQGVQQALTTGLSEIPDLVASQYSRRLRADLERRMLDDVMSRSRSEAIRAAMSPYGEDMANIAEEADKRVMFDSPYNRLFYKHLTDPLKLEQLYYYPRRLRAPGLLGYGQDAGLSFRQR